MRRILFALVICLGGAAILVSLGVWQVQRLAWKESKLAEISAMIEADPQPLATVLAGNAPRYSPVTLQGRFDDGHLRVLASRKNTGAVFRIIRPFESEAAGRVLIDTGWLPDGEPVPDVPDADMALIGNLDAPDEIDSFTPDPDLSANIWFARDVSAMAETLGTDPVLVVLRKAPPALGVTAWPVDTGGIPNDHLQYAITWFSLAAIWLAMSLYFLRRKRARPNEA